jgi:accessory gene regulator protein AgrB
MKDYEMIERLEKLKKVILACRIFLVLELVVLGYIFFTDKSDDYLFVIIAIIVISLGIAIYSVPKQFEARKLQRQLNERDDM